MLVSKQCSKCKVAKPATEFYRVFEKRTSQHTLSSWCRDCTAKYIRHHEASTVPGRAGRLLYGAKWRARRLGVAFDLTRAWVVAKLEAGTCEATGRQFVFECGFRLGDFYDKRNPWAPSIDRINPKGGYTQDNCRVVVWVFNEAKMGYPDAAIIEMARLLCSRQQDAA